MKENTHHKQVAKSLANTRIGTTGLPHSVLHSDLLTETAISLSFCVYTGVGYNKPREDQLYRYL